MTGRAVRRVSLRRGAVKEANAALIPKTMAKAPDGATSHPAGLRPATFPHKEGRESAIGPHNAALPTTGVEGAAMSRGAIGPARKAARPASIASAKPRAIATGSPALAIAVLSSTAS